jgi:hypothetical protein
VYANNINATTITGATNVYLTGQTNLPSVNNTYNLGSGSLQYLGVYATTFYGTATSAEYADLAERYHSDQPLDPGTVVCLGGTAEVTATTVQGSEQVFGVVSTAPAYLMNSDAGSDLTHPAIAVMGRVPCKVVGPVRKGQRVMASAVAGHACAWDPQQGPLAILGRVLVDKTSHGMDTIEIVVGKN